MGRRRKRRQTPPHPDPRVEAIFQRRKTFAPDVDLDAVQDVVAEGDPLYVCNHEYQACPLRDMFKHSPGFLVGGGPSSSEVDYMKLGERGICSVGVNNVCGRVPVDVFTCSDPPIKFHHGIWLDPSIVKMVPIAKLRQGIRVKHGTEFTGVKLGPRPMKVRDCPNTYGYLRNCEFRPEKFLTCNAATWGNNRKGVEATGGDKLLFTMFLGLRLCYFLGMRRCYLLGVDFRMGDGYGYSFGQTRDRGACRSNNNSYRTAIKWMRQLRPILEDAGMMVYNTNPNSSLDAFDYVPFESAVADCKRAIGPEPFDLNGWYEKT